MHSLANRLALLFAAIVVGAIGVVYLYVVPQLESSLRQQKLAGLLQDGRSDRDALVFVISHAEDVGHAVSLFASVSGDRVTLLGVNTRGQTYPYLDSSVQTRSTSLKFPIASVAVRKGTDQTGTELGPTGRVAEAALPLVFEVNHNPRVHVIAAVAVLSAPLAGVSSDVTLIRHRILAAGLLALIVAIFAGIMVARTFSRRVARLQRAAARVAAGDFGAKFPDDAPDELGDLSRTLDMMQRQLAELDDARKRFIATASHELRTPIFSLGGFLELLEDEDMDPDTRRQFVRQLREQAARLTRLATDLLDLSRLEAGSLDLRLEPTDIGALCRMVASEFTPALHQHESPLALELSGEPIEATCDPDRVAQIVRVLLDNALTHTPAGTSVARGAQPGHGRVEVAVTDGGPGIAGPARERVFEPFFTSDETQGSGLGLAIAHELAERMSGDLSVSTRPGHTTFMLAIPA
jgi:two-component system OmpR family sensor kinase